MEDFTVLGLSLPEKSACSTGQWSMPELVSNLLQTEVLGGVDALQCKACTLTPSQPQRTPSERRSVLVSTPKHLVVSLGRFEYDRKKRRRIKRLDTVHVDPTLVLQGFLLVGSRWCLVSSCVVVVCAVVDGSLDLFARSTCFFI